MLKSRLSRDMCKKKTARSDEKAKRPALCLSVSSMNAWAKLSMGRHQRPHNVCTSVLAKKRQTADPNQVFLRQSPTAEECEIDTYRQRSIDDQKQPSETSNSHIRFRKTQDKDLPPWDEMLSSTSDARIRPHYKEVKDKIV